MSLIKQTNQFSEKINETKKYILLIKNSNNDEVSNDLIIYCY